MGLSLFFWAMHISMSIMGFIMHGNWREQIHQLFSHTIANNGGHTLTLSGHIEPYQGKTNPIDLTLTYMTNSDNCLGSSFLMGANSSNQTKSRYFRLEPNSHHDYHLEIPINEYSPGVCDLEPFMIRFSNQHYSQSIIMFDEKDKTTHVPTQHITMVCPKNQACMMVNVNKTPHFHPTQQDVYTLFSDRPDPTVTLPANQNAKVIMNIQTNLNHT